ncbi:MAG TPA: sulfatase, partial [bacterium]|nr:sulfatase [bacterium]
MAGTRVGSYVRFTVQVAGAGMLGGVLAAAGEYALGAVFRRGAFWGEPRLFYQLLLGGEVLWVTLVTGAVFTVGASVFYAFRGRRAGAEITSAPTLILATAALGTPAFYYLAAVDGAWFYDKPRIITAAVFAVVVAAWFGAVWGVCALWGKVGARFPATARLPAHALRVSTLVLLIPFVIAEGRALWRARVAPPRRPDIYLVVMDAFRADRLSFYGAERELAPALENFGRQAVVFREAFTVSSWTKPAVASIFTAAYPGAHGVNARFYGIPEGANTLPDVLRGGGYFALGVSANPNVGRDALMSRGFDVMDNTGEGSILDGAGPPLSCARPFRVFPWARRFLGPLWKTTGDGVDLNRRVEFYRRLAGDRPAFVYIHYMETHTPNMPRPEYLDELKPFLEKVDKKRVKYIAGELFFWKEVLRDPSFVPDFTDDELALAKALYDADVRRADVVIADLLDSVVGASRSDRGAVVVITADHGEEFLEHGRWLHGAGLHHEVARIPLMVKAPDWGPAVLEGPVNLVDVPPTLAS